jgi:alanine dehydrogenase
MALILTRADVRNIVEKDVKEIIDIVEQGFLALYKGQACIPDRAAVPVDHHEGLCLVMPAYLSDIEALGMKMVTVYPNNPRKFGLPNVMAILVLVNAITGEPICVMDATYLTSIRTGAACAVATRHLALPDAQVLGVIGTGAQAAGIVRCITAVRQIDEIKVYSVDSLEQRTAFAREIREYADIPVALCESAEQAVRDSGLVAIATTSRRPVVSASWLCPGAHINAVGNHHPDSQEIDADTIVKSIVVCDSIDICMEEAGDIILPIKNGYVDPGHFRFELAQVVAGFGPVRERDDITLFKSVGVAIQDISVARYAYEQAVKLGVGIEVDLSCST